MGQIFANNVVSVTVGQTLATATSIQVAQGEKFPSLQGGDYFLATLVGLDGNGNENAWEIVRVIARSGNLLTVGRAEENTTAQTWPAGTRIEMRLTSGSLSRIDGELGGKLGSTGPQVLNVESTASALMINQAGSGNYLTAGSASIRNDGGLALSGSAENYIAGNTTFGNGAGVGGMLSIKQGVAGTTGGISWLFNTTNNSYGSLTLPYDTRATIGLHLRSSYPVTIEGLNTVVMKTADTERVRIESHGGIGIGGSGGPGVGMYFRKPLTGSINSYSVAVNANVASDVTSNIKVFSSFVGTDAAEFTLPHLAHFNASQGAFGTASTVSAQHGFRAQPTLIGAKVNYGFRSELPYQADIRDGSRWNFYASGAAPNYFGGRVRIGATTTISSNLDAFIITDVSSSTISAISTNTNTTATRTHIKLGTNDVEVGSIGTVSDEMYFGVAGSPKLNIGPSAVKPSLDNSSSLGGATNRWSTVYSASGTINTSDAREKTVVRSLSPQEVEAAKLLSKEIGAYRWLSSVQEKGNSAREHVGLTVQRAIEIMESCGLEPFKYGFICYDHWEKQTVDHPDEYESVEIPAVLDEEGQEVEPARTEPGKLIQAAWTEVIREAGDRYSFRYDELNLFLARGIEARLSRIEKTLEEL